MPREIALLTNPTAGKGREPRPAWRRCPGCARRASRSGTWRARRRRGARPGTCRLSPTASEALVVCRRRRDGPPRGPGGGRHRHPLGIIPAGTGNDVARYLDLPRKDPGAAADRVIAVGARADRPGPLGSTLLRDRAGRRVRRGRQRARQPDDLAEGPDALQPGHPRRAAHLRAAARTRSSSTAITMQLDAMLVAVGNGPSFGGGLRIAEGATARRRPARRRGHQADEQARAGPHLPQAVQGHPRRRHPQYEHHRVRSVTVAAPGIVSYADGERFGALPLTIECDPGR